MSYYQLAAEQNNIIAQYNPGVIYENGLITQQDYAKAVKYYQLAAKQGYSYAIYNLGLMLYNGKNIKQDYQKAF
ncbi:hypothetical protein BGI35_07475 [Snodgrassella communis]|nr:SEL1-like repeat protein [Snodgrassella communis]PIT20684.1 hypothetical protein BGI35_07475 [Snodgrassella communis]